MQSWTLPLLLLCVVNASNCTSIGGSLGLRSDVLTNRLSLQRKGSNVMRIRGGGEPKKKVMVTGGAGYIGTHCAVALTKAGYEVALQHCAHRFVCKADKNELLPFRPMCVVHFVRSFVSQDTFVAGRIPELVK